jgi:4-aminobutyrate aminotransferase-like enzyme
MAKLLEETKKRGLLIGKGGRWGNVVRIQPPLALSKGQIDEGLASLDEALTAVEKS